MNKASNLKRLMGYAGQSRALPYASGALNAPNLAYYGWMAVFFAIASMPVYMARSCARALRRFAWRPTCAYPARAHAARPLTAD